MADPGGSPTITALTDLGPNDVWALGYTSYGISATDQLAEHWDGTNWTAVPMVGSDNWTEMLGMAAVAPDDIWAVGYTTAGSEYGTSMLAEHWDGQAWTPTYPSSAGYFDASLGAVTATPTGQVWAVGGLGSTDGSSQGAIEHWNGTSWELYSDPNAGNGGTLAAVAALGDDDIWAVGGQQRSATGFSSLAEHWDGSSWQVDDAPGLAGATNSLSSIAALSSGDVWAVGSASTSAGQTSPLAAQWDGTSWSLLPVTAPLPYGHSGVQQVTASTDGVVWYLLGDSSLLRLCESAFTDAGIVPASSPAIIGAAAVWHFPAGNTTAHGIRDQSGLQLFDSTQMAPGSSFAYTYEAAGTYPVLDPVTGSLAAVPVAIQANPTGGGLQTTFQLIWAAQSAPSGEIYDVEIQRPLASAFQPWQTGTTAPSAAFTPDGLPGTYQFRSRLRRVADGATAPWSPTLTLNVHLVTTPVTVL